MTKTWCLSGAGKKCAAGLVSPVADWSGGAGVTMEIGGRGGSIVQEYCSYQAPTRGNYTTQSQGTGQQQLYSVCHAVPLIFYFPAAHGTFIDLWWLCDSFK